jgi:hypothetical protein
LLAHFFIISGQTALIMNYRSQQTRLHQGGEVGQMEPAYIVSKQVYEEFASYVQAYHHVLSKLSVNILQDIRIIVMANTTSLSLLRTAIDGAIIAAKARKSKAREARIISSRLPQGATVRLTRSRLPDWV